MKNKKSRPLSGDGMGSRLYICMYVCIELGLGVHHQNTLNTIPYYCSIQIHPPYIPLIHLSRLAVY